MYEITLYRIKETDELVIGIMGGAFFMDALDFCSDGGPAHRIDYYDQFGGLVYIKSYDRRNLWKIVSEIEEGNWED